VVEGCGVDVLGFDVLFFVFEDAGVYMYVGLVMLFEGFVLVYDDVLVVIEFWLYFVLCYC